MNTETKHCTFCNKEHELTKQFWVIRGNAAECKERIKDRTARWRHENVEKKKLFDTYYEALPERQQKKREWSRKYGNTYRQTNSTARMLHNLRKRQSRALKVKNKERKSGILGCSVNYFKQYIESQFYGPMTWDNYGTVWELDHILPLANYDLNDRATRRRLFHYTNLQPLLSEDNRRKSNKEDF